MAVVSHSQLTGSVLVDGSLRGPEGKEYYILPGQYDLKQGSSTLLVFNVSPRTITINKDFLMTRAFFKENLHDRLGILDTCSVSFSVNELDQPINCGDKLNDEELLQLQQLLSSHNDYFSGSLNNLGFTKATEMVIELDDSQPVVYRPYRMSVAERALVRTMVQEMLDSGIVRESSSPYASPIVLVQKKTGDKPGFKSQN